MLRPEEDTEDRLQVWDELQMLYMDTDPELSYPLIVRICGDSKYSLAELEAILFNEVLPAVRFNMFALPAPEWTGFNREWLQQRVLEKHRFGRRRPFILRKYTREHWQKLMPQILAYRQQTIRDED